MSRRRDTEGEERISPNFPDKNGEELELELELVTVGNHEEEEEDEGSHNHGHEEDSDENADKRELLQKGSEVEAPNSASSVTTTATCQSSPSTTAEEDRDGFNSDVYLPRKHYYYVYSNHDEGNVRTATLTFILILFDMMWSCGLSYWYFHLDHFEVAVTTLVIIILSGSITAMCFFTTRGSASARKNLWNCSRFAWLAASVPCLIPAILSAFYFISSVLDKATQLSRNSAAGNITNNNPVCKTDPGVSGPGANNANPSSVSSPPPSPQRKARFGGPPPTSEEWRTGSVPTFLIESLSLCFPLAVLHLCVLMEDPNSIPSLLGLYTLFGIFILSFSITFSRFQYDCLSKKDRFGEGTEKYLRFFYLWSAKIIWLVTFAILIVTARMRYPEWKIEATIGASAVMIAIHEFPLWICLLPHCGRLAAKVSSLFFLIPQFTSLVALIYWVNTDPMIYYTNIASIVLGVYFWSETVMLCGWLVDGSTEKDVDLVPLYPHFFGDVISSCFPEESSAPPTAVVVVKQP